VPGEKEKAKKDKFQKALMAYGQAMKPFHKGDYLKASELLKNFIEKEDTEKELSDRAKMYFQICEEHLKKKSVSLKTFEDYYNNGVFKINQGDYEDALSLLNKASELKPKEGKILYLLATVYSRMEKLEESLELLKKAIQIDDFFAILAQNEVDFESIKEDKKFQLITGMA
jgi:tetratricopeptide (TPR) repeat protein